MGELKKADFYDEAFGSYKHYKESYSESPYYDLWNQIRELIKRIGAVNVIELGCGPGQLAHLLTMQSDIKHYKGIDFSKVALDMAKERLIKHPHFKFEYGILEKQIIKDNPDVVIGTEVLEHVKSDFTIIRTIPPHRNVIFSVPCFDARAHVLIFDDMAHVLRRYQDIIDINYLEKFKIKMDDNKERIVILFKGVTK